LTGIDAFDLARLPSPYFQRIEAPPPRQFAQRRERDGEGRHDFSVCSRREFCMTRRPPPGRGERTERSLSRISIFDLRRRVENLRKADFAALTDDAVKNRIGRVIHQYPFHIRALGLKGLLRARRNPAGQLFTQATELWYPPAPLVTRPSRLNRPGRVLFYASSHPITAVRELRPVPGDVFTLLVGRPRNGAMQKMDVAFIGLERSRAPEVAHLKPADKFRTATHFRKALGEGNYRKWLLIDDYLSEIFAQPVVDGAEHLYKPTIALADILFSARNLDAVNYPSVATDAYGVNLCMLPEKADALLKPAEAWMLQAHEEGVHAENGEALLRVEILRRSHPIGADGVINWRTPSDGLEPPDIMRLAQGRIEPMRRLPLLVDRQTGSPERS
jgi:hypothetical protein